MIVKYEFIVRVTYSNKSHELHTKSATSDIFEALQIQQDMNIFKDSLVNINFVCHTRSIIGLHDNGTL